MLPKIDNNENYRVLAIDPGSSNLGFSFLESSLDDKINLITSDTINIKNNAPAYRDLDFYHEDKYIRLIQLKDVVAELLNEYQPHALVAESNYMGRFATGFAALVECVCIIRMCLYEFNPYMQLHMVDPTTVKTNIGMKRIRGTTKDDVKRALIASKKVIWNDIDPETLDEHSIDSVAIGVWFMENVL